MNYFCVLTLYDDSTKTKSLSMGCVLMYSKYDLLNDNKLLIIFFWNNYVNSFKSNVYFIICSVF